MVSGEIWHRAPCPMQLLLDEAQSTADPTNLTEPQVDWKRHWKQSKLRLQVAVGLFCDLRGK